MTSQLRNELLLYQTLMRCLNEIASSSVRVDDWTTEWPIIASNILKPFIQKFWYKHRLKFTCTCGNRSYLQFWKTHLDSSQLKVCMTKNLYTSGIFSWMIANALNLQIVYFSLMRPFCVVLFSFLFHKLCGIKHSCSNTVKFLFKFHLKICMSPQNMIAYSKVMVTFFIWKKWTSVLKIFFISGRRTVEDLIYLEVSVQDILFFLLCIGLV